MDESSMLVLPEAEKAPWAVPALYGLAPFRNDAALAAAVFSGWHYFGQFGEPFELRSFLFRWVCGVVFTLIYVFRGFAPVVWTHALYDIWVLAF